MRLSSRWTLTAAVGAVVMMAGMPWQARAVTLRTYPHSASWAMQSAGILYL
jgi:hypothetical protein